MSTQQKYIDIKEQRGQYWLENIMKDKFAVSMFGQKRLSREGGIEIVVKELCTRMARDGCQVTCYNRSGHHVSGAEYDNKIEYDGIRQKFVPTIEGKGLAAVSSSFFAALYTYDLARLLVDMNETEKYGYYHATNEGGYISWYDFTKEIYRQAGYKTEVLPVTTAEYGLSKAARPFNSRLDKSKLVEAGFTPLPIWQDALSRYLKEIEQ